MKLAPEVPMPIAAYHRIRRRLGWNYDYQDGRAFMRPADLMMRASLNTSASIPTRAFRPLRLCLVEEHNAIVLQTLFVDAFRASPDFFDMNDEWIHKEALFSIMLYLSGACGPPMTSSRALIEGDRPVGAMLIVSDFHGPTLHLAMIHPDYQRQGFGSALLAECLCDLHRKGFETLRSRYLIANDAGRRWHAGLGFVENPDSTAVRHFRHFYHYEVARLRCEARAGSPELEAAEFELEKWDRMAAAMNIE